MALPQNLETLKYLKILKVKNIKTADDWKKFDCLPALRNLLSWKQLSKLDEVVPKHFVSPLGRKLSIDYLGQYPSVELRMQELFGQKLHPMIKKKATSFDAVITGRKATSKNDGPTKLLENKLSRN